MTLYSPRGVSPNSAKKKKKQITIDDPKEPRTRRPRSPRGDSGRDSQPGRNPQMERTGGSGRERAPGPGARGSTTSQAAPPLQDQPSQRANSAFGQEFASGLFKDDIFANPEALATDWLSGQGVDPMRGGGLPAVYRDLASALPELFALTQGTAGGQGSAAGLGIESFLDYADQFLNQFSTPGAGSLSSNVVGGLFDAPQNSLISNIINNPQADPQQQVDALLSLLGAGLGSSLPGPIANAYTNQAQGMGDQWVTGAWKGKGKGQTFADYLDQQGLADVFNF